jgi:hypothetical protein
MTTATLTMKVPAAPNVAAKPQRKSWLQRSYDALVEARMRQARRELAAFHAMVPDDEVKQAGLRVGLKDDDALPFTR